MTTMDDVAHLALTLPTTKPGYRRRSGLGRIIGILLVV
jgi:hypothetical protein